MKRNAIKIEVDGKVFNSITEASNFYGISRHKVRARLKSGWSEEEAFGVIERRKSYSEFDSLFFKRKFSTLRQQAKKRGIYFNLSQKYLEEIFPSDKRCPASGVIFDRVDKDNVPSVDRIFNNKGYIENNVVWVSSKVNSIKADVDSTFILKIANYYKNIIDNNECR